LGLPFFPSATEVAGGYLLSGFARNDVPVINSVLHRDSMSTQRNIAHGLPWAVQQRQHPV